MRKSILIIKIVYLFASAESCIIPSKYEMNCIKFRTKPLLEASENFINWNNKGLTMNYS